MKVKDNRGRTTKAEKRREKRAFPQLHQAAIRTSGFLPQSPCQLSRVCGAAAQRTGVLLGLDQLSPLGRDSVTSFFLPRAG